VDIHKPKPWHGLRGFLKEYLIIVVGVLTALGAEQGVEWLHWRHQAAVARDAIAFDLRRVLGAAAEKDAVSPCTAARLGDFSEALDQAQATHRLPALYVVPPVSLAWSMRSWTGLTSGQTLAHLSNRDQLTLDAINRSLLYLTDRSRAERDAWAVFDTMSGPGRPTSDTEIAGLRAALGQARYGAADQVFVARNVETVIARSGYLTRNQMEAAYREGLAAAKTRQVCLPPGAPPRRTRDAIAVNLNSPPVPPGQWPVAGVGVAGAISTER